MLKVAVFLLAKIKFERDTTIYLKQFTDLFQVVLAFKIYDEGLRLGDQLH